MRDRRRNHDNVSHERWLVSYADFITLLFAFFVVMFSSAQMDRQKTARLQQAIETAFQELGAAPSPSKRSHAAGPAPSSALARISANVPGVQDLNHKKEDFAAIRAELERALAPEIKRREVALRMEPDGLVVSLREIGFFDSGSPSIKLQAVEAFRRVAEVLREHDCAIRIEGHTDNRPIHTVLFASNWELSTARATGMVKTLIERYDYAPERLSAAGYAEFHPVAVNDTPEGQQLNRRVDIIILPVALPEPSPPSAEVRSLLPAGTHAANP